MLACLGCTGASLFFLDAGLYICMLWGCAVGMDAGSVATPLDRGLAGLTRDGPGNQSSQRRSGRGRGGEGSHSVTAGDKLPQTCLPSAGKERSCSKIFHALKLEGQQASD